MDDSGCRPDRSRIAFFVKVDYCLALALGSFASHLPPTPLSSTNRSVNLEFIFVRHSFRPWKNSLCRGRVWVPRLIHCRDPTQNRKPFAHLSLTQHLNDAVVLSLSR